MKHSYLQRKGNILVVLGMNMRLTIFFMLRLKQASLLTLPVMNYHKTVPTRQVSINARPAKHTQMRGDDVGRRKMGYECGNKSCRKLRNPRPLQQTSLPSYTQICSGKYWKYVSAQTLEAALVNNYNDEKILQEMRECPDSVYVQKYKDAHYNIPETEDAVRDFDPNVFDLLCDHENFIDLLF
ncbi:hypothetical protein CHS0354_026930 [Potamilus streckersoni]|uniref:Uncharacterized protein n=1 Tax=Potamilus streckersoni TaxID=2493646 RepID=A0AAE0SM55_9BIVA|nr:hypothetical protein CHS0354_026930 [Potamilus streckersoni]